MRTVNKEARRAKQIGIMETCYDCYAEKGLNEISLQAIAEIYGCNVAVIYHYFENQDDLIIKSTEYCMSKVEEEVMAKASTDAEELWTLIDEIPYWMAEKHGKKCRLMYQIYSHPKYREYGQKFLAGVNQRYTEYAGTLEGKLGIPAQKLTPLIFMLVRACVHYALFEDEFYLKSQIDVLKEILVMYMEKYGCGEAAGQEKETT